MDKFLILNILPLKFHGEIDDGYLSWTELVLYSKVQIYLFYAFGGFLGMMRRCFSFCSECLKKIIK
jgi:hypothetical protein